MKTKLLKKLRADAHSHFRIVVKDKSSYVIQEFRYDEIMMSSAWCELKGDYMFSNLELAKTAMDEVRCNYIINKVRELRLKKYPKIIKY